MLAVGKENAWLRAFARNVTSQAGEDGILEQVLELIPEKNSWCVEFGAWDGVLNSNTHDLITSKRYAAILIEADAARFRKLEETYAKNDRTILVHACVGF